MAPTCYLHVGTHKTGTTSLQVLLTSNEELLAQAGIYVPRVGRPYPPFCGHHNIAWELYTDARFDPRHGTLVQLVDEIASARAPIVCVSSEDFEYLHKKPGQLEHLAAALRAIGYDVKIVIYLRPQADYAESLYAELVQFDLTASFSQFLETLLRDGVFAYRGWSFRFEYSGLLDAFANVFGHRGIIARAYRSGVPVDVLPRDFMAVVSGGATAASYDRLVKVERLNPSPTLRETMRWLRSNVAAHGHSEEGSAVLADERLTPGKAGHLDDRFRPLGLPDSLRMIARFWRDNRRIRARYGVRVPCSEAIPTSISWVSGTSGQATSPNPTGPCVSS